MLHISMPNLSAIMGNRTATPFDEDVLRRALDLLRGSDGYHLSTVLSFALSVGVVFFGLFKLDISQEHRIISILSMLYLISSSFTLGKTLRDRLLSEVLDIPLLAGTEAWWFQSEVSFLVALLASIYAAVTLRVEHKSVRGFVLVGLSFALSSSVSLSKHVRDLQDAEYFERQERNEKTYEEVLNLCAGTYDLYGQITWLFFAFDLVAFFYALKEFHLNAERVDFLSMSALFMIYSALVLAKAVRDSESAEEVLHPTQLHWTMYITACVVSVGLLFHNILRLIPMTKDKRAFLSLNTICILSVTFNLAKAVRDHQEIEWQQEQGNVKDLLHACKTCTQCK